MVSASEASERALRSLRKSSKPSKSSIVRTSEASFARERVKRSLRKSAKANQQLTQNGLSEQSELRERVSLAQFSQIKQTKQIHHGPCERSEFHV